MSSPTFQPNPEQQQAIDHLSGPMLVVAGAGTGKTTVLIHRIARLIAEKKAVPDEILAVTYTDNAAAELKQRVQQILPSEDCSRLKATTFHAYCNGILAGAGQKFDPIDGPDLWIYLRQRVEELELREFAVGRNPGEFLRDLMDFFSRCHDEAVSAPDYSAYIERLRRDASLPLPRVAKSGKDPLTREQVLARCAEIARVFAKVEAMLAADGLGSFSHMITGALRILREDRSAREAEQARARFILIDEFQDCNFAQIEIAHLLGGEEQNVFAVGDPDQAIYRFRGASSAAFEEFLRRFPKAKRLRLKENQRSTTPVLGCAHAIIAANPDVEGADELQREPLESAREKRGEVQSPELVDLVMCAGVEAEAAEVAATIDSIQRASGCEWKHFAVLYRGHAHREEVARELAARHIPVDVTGLNVLETGAVRDLMAVLTATVRPQESTSLFRVAALPCFHVDAAELRRRLAAGKKRPSFVTILKQVRGGEEVLAQLAHLRAAVQEDGLGPAAAARRAVRQFGLAGDSPVIQRFHTFAQEWQKSSIVRTGSLAEFMAYMDLFPEAGGKVPLESEAKGAGVRLMTVHAAKGLEFRHVFVLRSNSGSFPVNFRESLFEFPLALKNSVAEGDDKSVHGQEERRLYFVAMTRARDTLTLCAKPGRGKDPRPAGLLRELMADKTVADFWRQRTATAGITLAAAAEPAVGVAAWLMAPPADGRELSLSASAIERYDQCPLQYKIAREWQIPGRVSASVQFGSAMHEALKDFHLSVVQQRPKEADAVVAAFREAFSAYPIEEEHQRDLLSREGEEQLRAYVSAFTAVSAPNILAVEKDFEVEISGVRVRGRMDRVDEVAPGRAQVVDFKTGKAPSEEDAKKSLQLSIYALACERVLKLAPAGLVLHSLKSGEAVSATRSADELAKTEQKVAEVAANIAAQLFEPKPGFHCGWCEYRSLCPATEEKLYTIELMKAAVQ